MRRQNIGLQILVNSHFLSPKATLLFVLRGQFVPVFLKFLSQLCQVKIFVALLGNL